MIRRLLLTGLAVAPILFGILAHDVTDGNAAAGWIVFLLAVAIVGSILKATNLDKNV